mgnify:CR=1 FL=1
MSKQEIADRRRVCFEQKADVLEAMHEYMVDNHIGAETAILTRDLAHKYNVNTRTVKLVMKEILKNKRCPVISFQGTETREGYQGWFVAASEWEKDKYIETLTDKIEPVQRKISEINDVFYNSKYHTPTTEEAYI